MDYGIVDHFLKYIIGVVNNKTHLASLEERILQIDFENKLGIVSKIIGVCLNIAGHDIGFVTDDDFFEVQHLFEFTILKLFTF